MLRRTRRGYTLIELMIVVAIVAILAAIAIPAYQTYTIRAQVTEGISLVTAAKIAVGETYLTKGVWPASNAAADLAIGTNIRSKYVGSVTVGAGGVITVIFAGDAHASILGQDLTFTPYTNANHEVAWACGNKPVTATGMVVAEGAAVPGTGGSVTPKYRPPNCRA